MQSSQSSAEQAHNIIATPYYIVYEDKLRRNLSLISEVASKADVNIIMAFKANALWKTFPIIREYVRGSTASSLNEMRLSLDFLGDEVHAYCPVYTDSTFPEFLKGSTHITFNSLSQFSKYYPLVKAHNETLRDGERKVSAGLRVNPRCSVIETDIYNPCVPGSRFGELAENLPETLPEGLEGFHFHALCESSSQDLEKVLDAFFSQYGKWIPQLKWLNMGGGHLMTRKDYDTGHLISLLNGIHRRYPHLKLIMEPGSAFTWQTGDLVTEVLDVVENAGIKTAIIDASFACHMPDSLGCRKFDRPLKAGDRLTLLDMNHYTTVKTNMFNGIQHPSIWLKPFGSEPRLLRSFSYEDYRDRMD